MLTPSEQKWIKNHPVILCAPDPDFPPVEFFNSYGQYEGLVADYLELIFNRVGLGKKMVRLKKWTDVLDHARQKKIDLVTAAAKSNQRSQYLDFSKPFIEIPWVIITRQQVDQELTAAKLKGMKVSVVRQYAAHEYIASYYPDLDLDLVPDIHTGLRKVSFGMVDAMVANIASVSYYIEKKGITNLKVAGEIDFVYELCFAPIKDHPELTQILNKGFASLSPYEIRTIYSKWISLERSPALNKRMLVSLVIMAGIIFLFIAIVIGWNRTLRRAVDEKTKALKREVIKHEKAKLAIAETEEKLAGIVNSITDHMVMLDENLNILWVNDAARKTFGNNLEHKKCYRIFAGRNEPCENCVAKKCFAEGQMQEREITLEKKDDSLDFRETTNAASLNQNGHPRTVVSIFRDITRKKALAAEAMRAGHLASIGELAAGVAHEINNPINSIINLAQILLNQDKKNEEDNDIALRMINEGTRIARIVSNLLVFAKDQKGNKMPVDLKDILSKTLALTETQIIKNGITIAVDLPSDLPMVFAHAQQIQQVFLNLINNARFALNQKTVTPACKKNIHITAGVENWMGRPYVRIIFQDNGTGIPNDVLDRVMTPFFTTKPGGEGTGLGLSISHGIVNDHNGRIKIESKLNTYTRVIVDLPTGDKS